MLLRERAPGQLLAGLPVFGETPHLVEPAQCLQRKAVARPRRDRFVKARVDSYRSMGVIASWPPSRMACCSRRNSAQFLQNGPKFWTEDAGGLNRGPKRIHVVVGVK